MYSEDAGREVLEVDSIFFLRSLPIVFEVGKDNIDVNNPELQHFLRHAVPQLHGDTSAHARIRVRSASSPEGLRQINKRLSKGRRDALLKVFEENGVKVSELQIDVVDEEYELLAFVMRQANDPDAALVSQMVAENKDRPLYLKSLLQKYNHGKLWRRIYKQYFPQLRASRFVIVFPETPAPPVVEPHDTIMEDTLVVVPPVVAPVAVRDSVVEDVLADVTEVRVPVRVPRRELLSIKTNLLEWAAYVPQYGWCPMPNVELEYYPKKGHWTFGATFDFPWWKGNTENHKYFELNNYQLYARYYTHDSDRGFRGFYLQGYAQAFLYQIGFNEDKGWVGEGIGGGVGIGYALPLSRNGRWKLDFGMQLGVFVTKYDPYVYGCPVENVKDGYYYYDYTGDASLFRKREYSLTWFGPTRIGISVSYNLFYRRGNGKKGISVRHFEKGDEL